MDESILDRVAVCPKCGGAGKKEVHQPGMIHYETDSDDEICPPYHYQLVWCEHCGGRGVVLK